jgi:hypothetical protein
MSTKRSYVVFYHDTGYGDDLLLHINEALGGRDMIAESVHSVPEGYMQTSGSGMISLKDILCRFQAYVERGRTPRQAISDTYRFYGVKED